MHFTLVSLLLAALCGDAANFDSSNVVFVVLSQPEPYHASVAARLREDIIRQAKELHSRGPAVHLSHERFPIRGAWTVAPLLAPLLMLHGGDAQVRWVFFCEPHTALRYRSLIDTLSVMDVDQRPNWFGYPLYDMEPTIIHHFQTNDESPGEEGFPYPYFAAGFGMNMALIRELVAKLQAGARSAEADFSIDPAYELAQLAHSSAPLTGELSLCVVAGEDCTSYARHYDVCGNPIPEDSIYFAVKTYHKFHDTRARIVKKTWGRHLTNLMFFSDKADVMLPAVNFGIPNTDKGHCAKTMAILKYVSHKVSSMPHIKWIFLADDDTILGVKRLCELLSCLQGGNAKTVIGERYGYGYIKPKSEPGYDYITGGGGIAFSTEAARILAQCICQTPSSPDDMVLGACAAFRFNITLTHSPLFHQARPEDYSKEYLARDRPVSFHKHWMVDPVSIYREWFESDDLELKQHQNIVHGEL